MQGHSDKPCDFFLNVHHANYACASMSPHLKTHLGTITGSAFTEKAAHKLQVFRRWRPCSPTMSTLVQRQLEAGLHARSLLGQPGQSHTNCPAHGEWWSMWSSTSLGWQNVPWMHSWCILAQRDKPMEMSSAAARNDLRYVCCNAIVTCRVIS